MALTTSLNRFIRERFNFSLTLVVVACVLVFSACSGSGSTGLKTVSTISITQETGVDEYTPATTPDKSEIPTIKPESSRMPDTSAAPKPDPTSIPTSQIVVTQEPELTPSPDVSSGPTSEPSVSLTPTVEVAPTSLPVPQPTNTELSLGFSADQTAEDFTLTDLNGTEVSLFQLLDEKPVMLQFGSYT